MFSVQFIFSKLLDGIEGKVTKHQIHKSKHLCLISFFECISRELFLKMVKNVKEFCQA